MRATTIATQGLALCVLYALASTACADEPAPQPPGPEAAPQFTYRSGEIVLPNKVATLHLGEKYRYLDQAQTEKLLVAWGNEPGTETEGARNSKQKIRLLRRRSADKDKSPGTETSEGT